MKCPVCNTVDLVMSDRQGVEIDYCPQCRGVWLDRGELDKIIDRSVTGRADLHSLPCRIANRAITMIIGMITTMITTSVKASGVICSTEYNSVAFAPSSRRRASPRNQGVGAEGRGLSITIIF